MILDIHGEPQQAPTGQTHVRVVGLHSTFPRRLEARPAVDDGPVEAMALGGIEGVQDVAVDVAA